MSHTGNDLSPLHRGYLNLLENLHEAGGHARVNEHGRLEVGPSRHPLSGDPVAWLKLVARGYVRGELDNMILTQAGRDKVAEMVAGRTRVATF